MMDVAMRQAAPSPETAPETVPQTAPETAADARRKRLKAQLRLEDPGVAQRVAALRRDGVSWMHIAIEIDLGTHHAIHIKQAMRETGLLEEHYFGHVPRRDSPHMAEHGPVRDELEAAAAAQRAEIAGARDGRDLAGLMFGDPPRWRSALAERTGEMPPAIARALRATRGAA